MVNRRRGPGPGLSSRRQPIEKGFLCRNIHRSTNPTETGFPRVVGGAQPRRSNTGAQTHNRDSCRRALRSGGPSRRAALRSPGRARYDHVTWGYSPCDPDNTAHDRTFCWTEVTTKTVGPETFGPRNLKPLSSQSPGHYRVCGKRDIAQVIRNQALDTRFTDP